MKGYGMKKWKVLEEFIQRDEMGRCQGKMAGKIDSLMVSSDNTKYSG